MFEIQSRNRKNNLLTEWGPEGIGEPNEFASRDEAWAAIRDLQSLGEDWADAEYRVVEIYR